jgi:hypothetical protein
MQDDVGFWGTTKNAEFLNEAAAAGESCRAVLTCLYPSHLRPVLVQRRHSGFVSSHLTRRVLIAD